MLRFKAIEFLIEKFIGRLLFTLVFGSNPLFFLESICDDHFPKKLFFLLFLDVIVLNYYSLSLFVIICRWNDSVHEKYRKINFLALRDSSQKREREKSRPLWILQSKYADAFFVLTDSGQSNFSRTCRQNICMLQALGFFSLVILFCFLSSWPFPSTNVARKFRNDPSPAISIYLVVLVLVSI